MYEIHDVRKTYKKILVKKSKNILKYKAKEHDIILIFLPSSWKKQVKD